MVSDDQPRIYKRNDVPRRHLADGFEPYCAAANLCAVALVTEERNTPMRIGVEKKWWFYIGRGLWKGVMLQIVFAFGFRPDADLGEVPWRHYWEWSSDRLPYLVWHGNRPIGFCAFGRCRVWRT